jgi:hypothetical protein
MELSVVKPVFHLQSLYYFGIKSGAFNGDQPFVQQVFLSNCPLAIEVHQGQVGEIAFSDKSSVGHTIEYSRIMAHFSTIFSNEMSSCL